MKINPNLPEVACCGILSGRFDYYAAEGKALPVEEVDSLRKLRTVFDEKGYKQCVGLIDLQLRGEYRPGCYDETPAMAL